MQEKESIMVVRCELKIPSLGMPNSYPRDGFVNPHLTTIKDSYNPKQQIKRRRILTKMNFIITTTTTTTIIVSNNII